MEFIKMTASITVYMVLICILLLSMEKSIQIDLQIVSNFVRHGDNVQNSNLTEINNTFLMVNNILDLHSCFYR
ncbi:hypothetical protein XENTR_v10005886 [Xenopus tropicalis]|nr:hypothetical protein XENTR_v10005886 [Xenopus tropicalis]